MRLSTRLTLAMVALVLLTATAVGFLTYRNVAVIALPRALDRIDVEARIAAAELQAVARQARSDVIAFRSSDAITHIATAHATGAAAQPASAADAEWRKRVADRFVAKLTGAPDYAQFRLIGIADGGREIVRVERSEPGAAIRIVSDDELQRKGDREYFVKTIGLAPDDIYVSPIDLNQELGVIHTPHVPTLRVAAAMHGPNGEPFGIVIINVDLRAVFARIRSPRLRGARLFVINSDGDYLLHPDANREFGFQLGRRFRVQDEFPETAAFLAQDTVTPRILADGEGDRFGVGWRSVRLADGPRVIVMQAVPYTQVIGAVTAIRNASLLGGLAALFCALILAVAVARSLTKPLVRLTKAIQQFTGQAAIALPRGGGHEISVLAGAFNKMAAEVRTKAAALESEIEERRLLFDTSPDLILVTDRQGNFTRVSPSCQAILGYRPKEMVNRSAIEFIHAADLEATRNEMRLARRGRITRNFDTRYVHKNGKVVTLAWTGVWSEAARRHFFFGRDITEQKTVEEKFRLAVEASPSGLVMIDHAGLIVLVNSETERLFGYDRRELIGQPVEILVPERLRAQHLQDRHDFVRRPQTRRMGAGRDLYAVRKDGTEFPVEIGLNPIRTQGDLLVLGVIVDISSRKRAEAEIRRYAEREQLFIAAVESSNDAIVTKSLDGVITGWNQAAEHLFGYSSQEVVGKSIDIIVPEHLRSEVRMILTRIRNGERVEHHETVRLHKDGTPIDVSLSISPVKAHSGAVIGAAKVARDIRAWKRAQAALVESERVARSIIDTALDAFIQLDESFKIIEWSPKAEQMFGWSRDQVIGQQLGDVIIPPDNRAAYSERMAEFLRHAQNGVTERRYDAPTLHRDGRTIQAEVSLTALHRDGGYIINGFLRDITEKLAADEQLRQAQKMESVGQLTGGIAHDFNNMLTVVTGTIDILANAVKDSPQHLAIAKLISEAADRGAELTGHLLAFARKQPLQPRDVDTNALLSESEKLLRRTLGEQVEIEVRLEKDAWPALVDPTQLTTALVNLAVNARDAMPNGGKLTLETKNVTLDERYVEHNFEIKPGDYVMIAVSDTGQGIPETLRNKIFEPFFTTKEVGRGTGLGLSMVYGFVKQSGGHIKVYSEVGHGTTFKLYLPRASVMATELVGADAVIEGGNETILVVEDDALVRNSVITQLQSLGYQTISTESADEALAIVESGTIFDLLFTDVIMPKMNGRQLAEEIAKRRPFLRVLFTSGYTENAIIHHGRLDPGVFLLPKPYRTIDLARMVRSALGGPSWPARTHQAPKARAG